MSELKYDVAIIGGGASGFFNACILTELCPGLTVCILEKSNKVLSKVKISGGGRCNVTHHTSYVSELLKNYPNGKNFLKKVFKEFEIKDTVKWFESKGVPLKVEADGRMFPQSNNSESIVNVLSANSIEAGVQLKLSFDIESIHKGQGFELISRKGEKVLASHVVIATGGYPKLSQFKWLTSTGHTINPPVPSLFTFNIPINGIEHLKGLSVKQAKINIVGEKLSYEGPLLITHWGLSGPAILKLSAWGARLLNAKQYEFDISVNWVGIEKEIEVIEALKQFAMNHPKKKVLTNAAFDTIPNRLWTEIAIRSSITDIHTYQDLGNKTFNKMLENIFRMPLSVAGKTTFKEEFVTSGGIMLSEVKNDSMESKLIDQLYFTGEVLDIDGITGGFNFQAAWSTAYIAAKSIAAMHKAN